jgi:hypothetical protein
MNPTTTPVVLVAKGTKLPFLSAVIEGFQLYTEMRNFCVICPRQDVAGVRASLNGSGVRVVDEESVIPGVSCSVVCEHMPAHVPGWPARSLAGWYYQQFLKMGFARFPFDDNYYLIWDADTLLARPVSFYQHGRVLLTRSTEYHLDYFHTLKELLPRVPLQPCSHISQHMLVTAADMSELLEELSCHGLPWWKRILMCLRGTSPQQFSEYETYAAYCLWRWPHRYRSISRRWLRGGTSYFGTDMRTADLSRLAGVYDYVSFEDWDVGLRRRIRSRLRVAKARAITWFDRHHSSAAAGRVNRSA